MQMVESNNDLGGVKFYLFFSKLLSLLQYFVHFSATYEWHYEVEAIFCLEKVLHVA